jgi:hypothetical protein
MKSTLSIFALMILAAIMIAFTDSRTISGKVTDGLGQPVPGVIVKTKGSTNSLQHLL